MFWVLKSSFVVDILAFFYLATFWAIFKKIGNFFSYHLVTLVYNNNLEKLSIFGSTIFSLLHYQLKRLRFLLCLSRNSSSFTWLLNYFCKKFRFYWVVMLLYFVFVSSITNLIYLKQLVSLYKDNALLNTQPFND
jgi:hypothetical protein